MTRTERTVAFALQQLLGERARLLHYTHIAYLDRYLFCSYFRCRTAG